MRDAEKRERPNEPNLQVIGENDLRRGKCRRIVVRANAAKDQPDVEQKIRRHPNEIEEIIFDEVIREFAADRAIFLAEKL